jgi:hypothetical protein
MTEHTDTDTHTPTRTQNRQTLLIMVVTWRVVSFFQGAGLDPKLATDLTMLLSMVLHAAIKMTVQHRAHTQCRQALG